LSKSVGLAQATVSVPVWRFLFLRGFQDTRGHVRTLRATRKTRYSDVVQEDPKVKAAVLLSVVRMTSGDLRLSSSNRMRAQSLPLSCGLFVEVFSICTLSLAERTRHMSTLIRWPKPRYCVPLFVPLLKWFLGHKGTLGDIEGDKKQALFIDVFYFVQENRKVKIGPEASALIH
jgi:hypothetical protein